MKKKGLLFVLCGVILLTLGACGASSKEAVYDKTSSSPARSNYEESKADYDSGGNGEAGGVNEDALSNTSAISANQPNSNEKIIRRVYLDIETEDFDQMIQTVDGQILHTEGYIEKSEVRGRSYYSSSNRSATIVARIPKQKVDGFINSVKDKGNILNREEDTENITIKYVDAESHKKALQIEQERLLALLEKADRLEDILTLEKRLSSVRYEIERYEIQLRTYDNLVEYSTVTMSIREVKRITPIEEEEVSVWKRMSNGLQETMYEISEDFKDFMVGFIVSLPYIILWGGFILLVVLIIKSIVKRTKRKAEQLSYKGVASEKDNNIEPQKDDNKENK